MNKKYIKLIFTIIICIIISIQLIAFSYAFIQSLENQSTTGINYENTYILPFGYATLIIYISFLCITLKKELNIKFFKYVAIFIVIYLIILFFVPAITVSYHNGNLFFTNINDFNTDFTIYEYIFNIGGILIK